MPVAFQVTVWTCPTFQTEELVGLVIGGANTVRGSNGTPRTTVRKREAR